eukprot:9942759-Prorocentrum_lima.AAC.1
MLGGQSLPPRATLQACNIVDGGIVHLVLRRGQSLEASPTGDPRHAGPPEAPHQQCGPQDCPAGAHQH